MTKKVTRKPAAKKTTRKKTTGGRIRERNIRHIMKAAEKEFDQHGYGGARMQRIADRAGLPKANVHYYFKSKKALYLAVLNDVLTLWNSAFDKITVDDDPAEALTAYIHEKMELSRTRPEASRIFTGEIIAGAPHLKEFLEGELREWVEGRVAVIEHWIAARKLRPIDPYYLVFFIWSATQHFADYAAQIDAIRAKPRIPGSSPRSPASDLAALVVGGIVPNASRE